MVDTPEMGRDNSIEKKRGKEGRQVYEGEMKERQAKTPGKSCIYTHAHPPCH